MKRSRTLVLSIAGILILLLAQGLNGQGNPPSDECGCAGNSGDPGCVWLKFEFDDSGKIINREWNVVSQDIISLDDSSPWNYPYVNTDSTHWEVCNIVVKGGQDSQSIPPAQSGVINAPTNLSHITFCFCEVIVPPCECSPAHWDQAMPQDLIIEIGQGTLPDPPIVTATDNCSAATVEYYQQMAFGCGGTVMVLRIWTAYDHCNNSITHAQIIELVDTTPPTMICPPAITVGSMVDIGPNVTGWPLLDNDVVSYGFSDVQTASECVTTITRTWHALDDCGNVAYCSQIITVDECSPPLCDCDKDETAPIIFCPPDITVHSMADATNPAITGFATATDPYGCGVKKVFYVDCIQGTDCLKTIQRTWFAQDVCFNQSSCTQVVTVDECPSPCDCNWDTTPPHLICPGNKKVTDKSRTSPDYTGWATATDCLPVTLCYVDEIIGCGCSYKINRTWIATDICQNQSECLQVINVDTCEPDKPPCNCPGTPGGCGSEHYEVLARVVEMDDITFGSCNCPRIMITAMNRGPVGKRWTRVEASFYITGHLPGAIPIYAVPGYLPGDNLTHPSFTEWKVIDELTISTVFTTPGDYIIVFKAFDEKGDWWEIDRIIIRWDPPCVIGEINCPDQDDEDEVDSDWKVIAKPSPASFSIPVVFEVIGTTEEVERLIVSVFTLNGQMVWQDSVSSSETEWNKRDQNGEIVCFNCPLIFVALVEINDRFYKVRGTFFIYDDG